MLYTLGTEYAPFVFIRENIHQIRIVRLNFDVQTNFYT